MVRDYTPDEEKRIVQNEAERDILEAQRVRAMNGRDAKQYSNLCTLLGVDPELPELIERAKADEIYASRRVEPVIKQRKNRANPVRYQAFLDDAERCNYFDFASDTYSKREILMRHFPTRYERQGMVEYGDLKLGAVFKKIVDSAEEIVNRK